jgi:hypothetical protein
VEEIPILIVQNEAHLNDLELLSKTINYNFSRLGISRLA